MLSFMDHAAWITGPSWCRPEMDRFWSPKYFGPKRTRAFEKFNSNDYCYKKSNCIFDRRCNFFEKKSHFWKISKFSMTLSGPNVTQFVSILTQFTYWIYPCSTQTWITGQVPSYAKTWSIQLKVNWFQLPFSKAFRTLIILNFVK